MRVRRCGGGVLGCATGEDEDLKVQRGAMTVICRGKLRGNYMQGNRKSGTDAGKKQLSMASACQKGGGGRGKGGWVVDCKILGWTGILHTARTPTPGQVRPLGPQGEGALGGPWLAREEATVGSREVKHQRFTHLADWTKVAAGDFFIFLFLHCCCIVPSPAHITRRAHTDSSTLIPRRRNQSPSSIS